MITLSEYPLWMVFAGSLILFAVIIEISRSLGCRTRLSGGEQILTLQGAVLGLLALMIGFTFAMSLSRYEARRVAVLSEANSISSAAMMARLLPQPQGKEALTLLDAYVKIRLDLRAENMTRASLRTAVDKSNALQEKLWQLTATVAAADRNMVPTGLFIQSLSQVFDDQAKRVAAVRSHVPDIVLLGLNGIALVAMGFVGYENGVKGQSRLPPYLMAGLIAAVLLLIHDLDRPGSGFIRVSQLPMQETAESIADYLKRASGPD